MNSLQLLKLASDPAAILEKYRAMMERQVKQLTRLVDDLLEVSRWTRGTIELHTEAVALSGVVRDALAMSEPLIAAKRHALELTLLPSDLRVYGDPSRLVQAVSNLLNNAAKYTPPGGRIGVFLEGDEHEAILRITDTGVGIPAPMLSKVFELFVRADNSIGRENEGLGIGLTLAKQIIGAHGGTITARSDGEGCGSEFIVRLRKFDLADISQGRDEAKPALPRRRILVVDDNRDAADSMAAMLEVFGHDVRVAYGGADALAAVAAFQPEIVFLDIGMPGMSGYDVCQKIRRSGSRARMVALTGFGQESDRTLALDSGFDSHMVKPVSLEGLQNELAAAPV